MSIPIVANGDIKTLKDAENVHHLTGADGKIKYTLCPKYIYKSDCQVFYFVCKYDMIWVLFTL